MEGFIWDIEPMLLRLGPLQVRYYGLLMATVLLLGYYFWNRQMRLYKYSDAYILSFPYYAVFLAVLGARVGHCFFYEPGRYLDDPISILYIWHGGLSSHGATIGLLLSVVVYSWRYKMNWIVLADINAFLYAIIATLVRIGNFMNSEIVGRVTDVPWCVHFKRFWDNGQYCRHPSQIYEASFGFVIFILLYIVDRALGKRRPTGLMAGIFVVVYFIGRFIVEFFKEYQVLSSKSPLTMGQYLSIPFVLLGIYLLYYAYQHRDVVIPDVRDESEMPAFLRSAVKQQSGGKSNKKKKSHR